MKSLEGIGTSPSQGKAEQLARESEIASASGQVLGAERSPVPIVTDSSLWGGTFADDTARTYEKRFQIPEDIALRERLKGIQSIVRDFKKEYPEVLSFTMYGSMVKNTATPKSDIDGTLFVEATPTGDEEFDAKVSANIKAGYYLNKFKTELQKRLDLTLEQVGKDVKSESISEDDVTNATETYMLSSKLYEEERMVWENSRIDTGRTEETTFGILRVYEYDGEESVPPSLPDKISAMFNLDIGGGIRKYRQLFLISLESLEPGRADDICKDIYAHLSFSEGGKRNEVTKLPYTYA